ncbi:hypothetical protein HDU98_004830, partial [Podochytrium sp. JEL0797]
MPKFASRHVIARGLHSKEHLITVAACCRLPLVYRSVINVALLAILQREVLSPEVSPLTAVRYYAKDWLHYFKRYTRREWIELFQRVTRMPNENPENTVNDGNAAVNDNSIEKSVFGYFALANVSVELCDTFWTEYPRIYVGCTKMDMLYYAVYENRAHWWPTKHILQYSNQSASSSTILTTGVLDTFITDLLQSWDIDAVVVVVEHAIRVAPDQKSFIERLLDRMRYEPPRADGLGPDLYPWQHARAMRLMFMHPEFDPSY